MSPPDEDKLSQIYLINNFNEFSTQAFLHLDAPKIPTMDEKGCCFALSQYELKKASEGPEALNEFYTICNFVSKHLTPALIADWMKKAKIQKDFKIQISADQTMKFNKLVEFMSGIAKMQAGFKSTKGLSRFSEVSSIPSKGAAESIAGTFENNRMIQCNRDNIGTLLKAARTQDTHYALVTTGGHAINFRSEGPQEYYVYDPNDLIRPQKLSSLQAVGEAIHIAFVGRLGHKTESGNMILSIKGLSFGSRERELLEAIKRYKQSLFHSRPASGLSKMCHDIIMKGSASGDHVGMGLDLDAVYQQFKESQKLERKIENYHDFIRLLPPTLKPIVKASLDNLREQIFIEAIEKRPDIPFDPSTLTESQKNFMLRINSNIHQYHEGHLSREDLAMNLVAMMNPPKGVDISEFPVSVQAELNKVKEDMSTFLEGELCHAGVICENNAIELNRPDTKGYTVGNRSLYEGPNRIAIEALLTSAQKQGETLLLNGQGIENTSIEAFDLFLEQANVDTIDYLMKTTDCRSLLTQNTVQKMIGVGHCDLIQHWLTTPLDERYEHLVDQVLSYNVRQDNIFSVAMKHNHLGLAQALVDKQFPLSESNAAKILKLADPTELRETRERQRVDYFEAVRERRENQEQTLSENKDTLERDNNKSKNNDKGKEEEGDESQTDNAAAEEAQSFEAHFEKAYQNEFRSVQQWQGILSDIIATGNEENITVLFKKAIELGNVNVAKDIVLGDQSGSEVATNRQEQLLLLAAEKGDIETIVLLVDKNPELVNAKDAKGISALSKAASVGRTKVVNLFIQEQAEVKHDSSSPLYFASYAGNVGTCKVLLEKGASIESRSEVTQNTPLTGVMLSSVSTEDKNKLIHVLLNEPDLKATIHLDSEKSYLVHEAIIAGAQAEGTDLASFSDLPKNKSPELSKIYLEIFHDDKLRYRFKAASGKAEEGILNIGVKGPLTSEVFDTIYSEVFEQLAQQGHHLPKKTSAQDMKHFVKKFNVDLGTLPTPDKRSLALQALESDNLALTKRFLKKTGFKAEEKAEQSHKMLEILFNKIQVQENQRSKHSQNGIPFDSRNLDSLVEMASLLINKTPEVANRASPGGQTLLMSAVLSKNTDVIGLLIDNGANPNTASKGGETALHYAVKTGMQNNINLLAEIVENVSPINEQGEAPLHTLAKQTTTVEALKKLVGEEGLGMTDGAGNTVLHLTAKKEKNTATVKELLAEGLNPLQKNGVNKDKDSAFDITLKNAQDTANKPVSQRECGNLAVILQAIPYRTLDQDRQMLDALKPLKQDILVAYKTNIANAFSAATTSEEKNRIAFEIDRATRGQDAVGRLFKTKLRLNEFRLDNDVMKELQAFKRGLIESRTVESNRPEGPRNR